MLRCTVNVGIGVKTRRAAMSAVTAAISRSGNGLHVAFAILSLQSGTGTALGRLTVCADDLRLGRCALARSATLRWCCGPWLGLDCHSQRDDAEIIAKGFPAFAETDDDGSLAGVFAHAVAVNVG